MAASIAQGTESGDGDHDDRGDHGDHDDHGDHGDHGDDVGFYDDHDGDVTTLYLRSLLEDLHNSGMTGTSLAKPNHANQSPTIALSNVEPSTGTTSRSRTCPRPSSGSPSTAGFQRRFLFFLAKKTIFSQDQCKLYCRVEYSSAYYLLAASVADGTPCGVDTFNKCIAGRLNYDNALMVL